MKKPLREVLSEMTMSEKVNYIWEYYKLWIIGGLFLILIVSYSVYEYNNKKEDILNIVLTASMVDSEKVDELRDELHKNLLTDEERDKSNILIQSIGATDVMDGAVQMQKMAAELSIGAIGIFIVDKEFFDRMNDDDQLLALDKLEGVSLPYDKDKLVYSKDGNDLTGIPVESISLFKDVVLEDGYFLCVPLNSEKKENITRFLQYMVDQE